MLATSRAEAEAEALDEATEEATEEVREEEIGAPEEGTDKAKHSTTLEVRS